MSLIFIRSGSFSLIAVTNDKDLQFSIKLSNTTVSLCVSLSRLNCSHVTKTFQEEIGVEENLNNNWRPYKYVFSKQ